MYLGKNSNPIYKNKKYMRTLFTLIAFYLIFLVSCKREEPRYLRKNANTKSATSDLAALNKALKIF